MPKLFSIVTEIELVTPIKQVRLIGANWKTPLKSLDDLSLRPTDKVQLRLSRESEKNGAPNQITVTFLDPKVAIQSSGAAPLGVLRTLKHVKPCECFSGLGQLFDATTEHTIKIVDQDQTVLLHAGECLWMASYKG